MGTTLFRCVVRWRRRSELLSATPCRVRALFTNLHDRSDTAEQPLLDESLHLLA